MVFRLIVAVTRSVRNMASSPGERYVGTSVRGLTKEFSFPVPWGQVSGKTWGSEKNPPIICMHGWLDNCNTFDKLIPLLPQNYYYVAFDMPGHGLSSHIKPGMFYFTLFYCAVVKRLLDHFRLKQVTILGHSMGGNVGAYFGGLYPEIVHSLIILDTAGLHFRLKDQYVAALRSCLDSYLALETGEPRQEKEYTYEQAKERLKVANSRLTEEAVEILLERGMKEEKNGMFTFRRDLRHNYRDAMERDLTIALANVANMNAHVLAIWAKEGLPIRMQEKYGDAFKMARETYEKHSKSLKMVTVEGNHHMHLCTPKETAEYISQFLTDVRKEMEADSSNL